MFWKKPAAPVPDAPPVPTADPRAEAEARLRQAFQDCRGAAHDYQRDHGHPLFLLDRPAAQLPAQEYETCRVFSTREAMISAMATGPVGVEVGVAFGGFSRHILAHCGVETLHLLDRDFSRLMPEVENDPRTVLHEGDSADALSGMPDGSADWIYIDADHRYAGCHADAQVARRKIRPQGLLFFNDYSVWAPMNFVAWGVPAVVHEFLNEGWHLRGITLGDRFGSHDVVLSPPAGTEVS